MTRLKDKVAHEVVPAGRMVEPADDGSYVTGSTIVVDGGLLHGGETGLWQSLP